MAGQRRRCGNVLEIAPATQKEARVFEAADPAGGGRVYRRLLPGEDPEQMLADVQARVAALRLEQRELAVHVELTMDKPGFATAADDPFVRATMRALDAAGGPGLAPAGWTAACDGGFVARATGAPVVVLGAGSVTDQAHRPDESVGVGELAIASRCYALLALEVLSTART